MKKTKREQRRAPGKRVVTERDVKALLMPIARCGPIGTRALSRYAGISADMTRRRLRVLRDHGLAQPRVRAVHEETTFVLTKAGKDELVRRLDLEPGSVAVPRADRRETEHHRASVDVFVSLSVACKRSTRVELVNYMLEAELRRELGDTKGQTVPDGVALLQRRDGAQLGLAFEVDMGLDNPSRVAASKGRGYAALRAANVPLLGADAWVVVMLTTTRRRMHSLVRALHAECELEGLWFFGLLGDVDETNILEPTLQTLTVSADGMSATLTRASVVETFGPAVSTDRRDSRDRRDDTIQNVSARLPQGATTPFASGERQ